MSASWAIAAWGTPKPRNAPATGLFVYTARDVARTASHPYGPPAWTGTRWATVGPQDAYAPVSKSPWKRKPVSRPSGSAPALARMRAGWRLVLAAIDSGRVQAARTGRSSSHAAKAMSGWTPRSSLPPKPPPHAVGMIRTRSGDRPRMSATSSRSMYGVWVLTVSSMRSPTRRANPASGSM